MRQRVLGDLGQPVLLLFLCSEECNGPASDRLMRGNDDGRGSARHADAFEYPVVACDSESTTTVFLGDDHAHDTDVEESLQAPVRDLLNAIDLRGGMFVAKIVVEFGQELVATRGFLRRHFWKRNNQFASVVAPEEILHESHGLWIGAQHFLGLFDLLAIFFRDVLQVVSQIRLTHVTAPDM